MGFEKGVGHPKWSAWAVLIGSMEERLCRSQHRGRARRAAPERRRTNIKVLVERLQLLQVCGFKLIRRSIELESTGIYLPYTQTSLGPSLTEPVRTPCHQNCRETYQVKLSGLSS